MGPGSQDPVGVEIDMGPGDPTDDDESHGPNPREELKPSPTGGVSTGRPTGVRSSGNGPFRPQYRHSPPRRRGPETGVEGKTRVGSLIGRQWV